MSIKINFDASHNPEQPTLVLATRNGTKLGGINARNIVLKESSTSEISFVVNKYVDGVEDELWEKIKNFKLVWCKEWDTWFEIYVEIDETDNTQKIVSGVNLGVAELSQAVLYGMQVNTEEDIAREDYSPTVLWDDFNKGGSLLHRILLEKAQHYKVIHVDDTIAKIQRTFTFDGVSIYDAFQQISEEIGCIFVLNSDSDEDGNIQRTISVYDTHSICNDCHYRGDFIDVCPECSSTNVTNTYGEDTTIFITSDDLTDDIQFTSDTDSIKNCFKLVAGDDLMTATVMNCNPNGSDYIWRFSEETREDMNPELVKRIDEYDKSYEYYQKEYVIPLSDDLVKKYNDLVDKYSVWNPDLKKIESPVKGYPALMDVYYDVIDFAGYLRTSLMPNVEMDDTSAEAQAALLTETNMNPIAVTDLTIISSITAENAVLNMARCIVDQRYQVKIGQSAFSNNQWSGDIIVVNYSDKEDTATSKMLYITITEDFKTYIEQKIYKALAKTNGENMGIVGLFERELDDFKDELKEYSLDSLKIFLNCCQGCLDVMVEAGVADESAWLLGQDNLYAELYTPYYQKYTAIEEEMAVRQSELDVLEGVLDINGGVVKDGLQTQLEEIKEDIQSKLNFQTFLGDTLWLEFCAYRRDDEYSNQNFVSDGLTNAELFSRAREFLKLANEELYRSSELQHSVTVSSLKNFLLIDRFKGFADHFEIGNWMRVRIDDKVYKLRLLEYEIDYDSIENISVTFSDVIKVTGGLSSVQTALQQVQSMASSYDSVQRQAVDGAQGSKYIKTWFEDGLDVTNTYIANNSNGQVQTWDEHGMLFRAYDPISEMYDEIQMKIINSTLVVTDDNWEHVKTAIGMFYYVDPVDSQTKVAYGINAEMVIGKMILGQNLGLYNDDSSLTFNKDGLTITNGTNTFVVNPNDTKLLKISNDNEDVLWVDDKGKLHIRGDGAGLDIESNDFIKNMDTRITQNAEEITLEAKRAQGAEGDLSSKIDITAEQIRSEVSAANETLQSSITQTAEDIRQEVKDTAAGLQSSIDVNAEGIRLEAERAKGEENSLRAYIDITSDAINFVVQGDGKETSYTITDGAMKFIAENIQITGRVTIDWFESDTKNTFNESLKDTETLYAINNSSTTPPSLNNLDLWSKEVDWSLVQNSENHFVWQIVVTTNNNGDKITSAPVCISEGKEIKKIETQYKNHTSQTDPPTDETGWSVDFPTYNVEQFIWSRQLVTYTDGTTKAFDLKFESGLTQAFQRSDNVADVVSGMHYVYYQPTEPPGNHVVGDVWYKTQSGTGEYGEVISINLWVVKDGIGKWEEQKNGGTTILNGTISTDLIAANAITSEKVAAHAIKGDMVDTGKLQVKRKDGTVLFLADMDKGSVEIVADKFSLTNGDTIYSVTQSAQQAAQEAAQAYADAALQSFIDGAFKDMNDKKAETWYQEDDPSEGWESDDLKAEHKGDLWYDTANEATKQWDGEKWNDMSAKPPQDVFDSIDGKAQIFTDTPTPPYNIGDLWFSSTTDPIKVCTTAKEDGTEYEATDWEKKDQYINQAYADSAASSAAAYAVSSQTQQDIFDKLTNGGTVTGIFLDDTGLYINASFMRVGTLSALSANLGSITAGSMKSSDYDYTFSTSNHFAAKGMMISLTDTFIRTPFFCSDLFGAYINGTIYATAGNIGGCTITNGVLQVNDANILSISSSKISVDKLSALTANLGSVTAGTMASSDYNYTYSSTNHFSSKGMMISLTDTFIRTPFFCSDLFGAYFKGDVEASTMTAKYNYYIYSPIVSKDIRCISSYKVSEADNDWPVVLRFGLHSKDINSSTDNKGGYISCQSTNTTFNDTTVEVVATHFIWGSKSVSTSTSDKRVKEDISEFTPEHEALYMELKPVTYKLKNGDRQKSHPHTKTHYGFIAQDISQTLEEHGMVESDMGMICRNDVNLMSENEYEEFGVTDYLYSLRYSEMVALNTHMTQKALRHQQDQDEIITEQRQQIEDLLQTNALLLSRLSILEQQVASSN